jgi:superfamily II DNA helicase RecQ
VLTPAQEGGEPVDEREFEALRAWRMGRAEGKPAYTVASDAALRALLRGRAQSIPELLEVRGIGPAFCEKHGESLLTALTALDAGDAAALEPAGRSALPHASASLA